MENPEQEMAIVREGVHFDKAQLNDLAAAYRGGRPVEFESFSPYLADYDLAHGDIHTSELLPTDQTGLAIASTVREMFPQARMISLYDEYNSGLPETSDAFGRPNELGPQVEVSADSKERFRQSIVELMRERGVLNPGDVEGENYLMISESSKIRDAEQLVQQLEAKGMIRRDGQALTFVNPNPENPAYAEIPLRTKTGRWLCEALDASSYLKPENREISHLVVLPNEFREQ